MFYAQVMKQIPSLLHCSNVLLKQFSTSAVRSVGLKWRLANGYPENLTSRGILTDGPDYSHLDGNPTPYTTGQRARIIKQRQQAEKVHKMLSIINHAKKCYQEKVAAEQKEVEKILGRKLKPKGRALRSSKS